MFRPIFFSRGQIRSAFFSKARNSVAASSLSSRVKRGSKSAKSWDNRAEGRREDGARGEGAGRWSGGVEKFVPSGNCPCLAYAVNSFKARGKWDVKRDR